MLTIKTVFDYLGKSVVFFCVDYKNSVDKSVFCVDYKNSVDSVDYKNSVDKKKW